MWRAGSQLWVAIVACSALALVACSGSDFTPGAAEAGNGGEGGAPDQGNGATGGSAGELPIPNDAGSGGDASELGGATSGGAGDRAGGSSGGSSAGNSSAGSSSGGAPSTAGSGASGAGSAGAAGAAPVVKAFDDFVASAEGWTITGDNTTKVPTYSSTGGNPNGSISAVDLTAGVLFFTAPKKYLGNVLDLYGGELRFDLKATTTTKFFAYADVELTSNLTTLAFDCTPNPTTSWHTFTVPLSEKGWTLTTITGAAVTAAQFKAVLSNLTRLRIRGEFNDGADTGYLDNVYLGPKAGAFPGNKP